jgi:hypothetical protein
MKLLMMKLYSDFLLLPLKFKYTPGHPVLSHSQFMFFPNARVQASNPYKKNGKKFGGRTCCCDA